MSAATAPAKLLEITGAERADESVRFIGQPRRWLYTATTEEERYECTDVRSITFASDLALAPGTKVMIRMEIQT